MTKKRLGWYLILFSALSGVGWIWQWQQARGRAAYYQPTEATVVANRIHRQWANTASERSIQQFRAEYLLEYSYGGRSFRQWESDPLITTQRFRAEAVLGNMSPGARLIIYVNPQDPRQMTLDLSGWRAWFWAILFAALTTVSAGMAAILFLYRTNRRKNKREATAVVYLS